MSGLLDRAEAVVAEVVEAHRPGPDGFEDVCWGDHDETTRWSGEHVAAAVMAALVEQLGLREVGGFAIDFGRIEPVAHFQDGRPMATVTHGRLVTPWHDTTTEGAPA